MGKPDTVRIGCGSGGAIDRIELALDMVDHGVAYLGLDSLAERSLALAQLRMDNKTGPGYDTRIPSYSERLFPLARERGTVVIGNMGGADPAGAVDYLRTRAAEDGLKGMKVGLIEGDDVLAQIQELDPMLEETGKPLSALTQRVVCANAYTGYEEITEAISEGANVVIGGRISDSSLFLVPLVYEFGWAPDDWASLGAGTCVAHLLECSTYLTGGMFADPPFLTVESWDRPSLPFAEVNADGTFIVRKLPGSGGALSSINCKLQLGYEVHNPAAHPTPDVVADFSHVRAIDVPDGVSISGATGTERPEKLKVGVGVAEGFIGENQVSYAGAGAYERALLAKELLEERFTKLDNEHHFEEWRIDLLGLNATHGRGFPIDPEHPPYEVHVRGAARCPTRAAADAAANEVEYLALWGPAGAAGTHKMRVVGIVATFSTYLDRELAPQRLTIREL